MSKITMQEFIELNKTEDLCFELNEEKLTDDIDEYFAECYNNYSGEDLDKFCLTAKYLQVYTKDRFKLTSSFIFERIQDHLEDNYGYEDVLESYIGKNFFDEVCDKFNNNFETYTTDKCFGVMDLSKELYNYMKEALNV